MGLRYPGHQRTGRTFTYVSLPHRRYHKIGLLGPPLAPKSVHAAASITLRVSLGKASPQRSDASRPPGASTKRISGTNRRNTSTVGCTTSGAASSPAITQTVVGSVGDCCRLRNSGIIVVHLPGGYIR